MTDRTELAGATWRTGGRSGAEGDCVEIADNLPHLVAVRDSRDPQGPTPAFAADPWRRFVRTRTGRRA